MGGLSSAKRAALCISTLNTHIQIIDVLRQNNHQPNVQAVCISNDFFFIYVSNTLAMHANSVVYLPVVYARSARAFPSRILSTVPCIIKAVNKTPAFVEMLVCAAVAK